MRRILRWLTFALIVGGSVAIVAPEFGIAASSTKGKGKAKAKEEAAEEEVDAGGARRLPTRVTKLRQDSVLRRDKPISDTADMRGSFERRRDHEVIIHYRRVAELDVIAAVARREKNLKMLDRVQTVRRKELRRFWAVMQELREVARIAAAEGTP